jgi:predicted signal transduction protein with EAL and GGDEF domain
LGPAAADNLVREVARRLSAVVRVRDIVARLGDTEFAVLTAQIEQQQDAGALAERILAELRRPVKLAGYQVVVPAVIGIAVFPYDGRDTETLLRNASAALQGAREDAVINYRFFTGALNQLAKNRIAISSGLSRAMERREFSLVYQPKVDIASWRILGVEALLRWRTLDLGPIPPDEFVPVLERTGLISDVGNWVLETACRQRRVLKDAGFPEVRMAVNLSVRQVRREFLGQLAAVLVNSGLEPGDLELEITESVIVRDGQAAVGLLREIAAMGIHLSMDDFGCGYSSLSHLRRLPLDTIKIDRSFVADVATDPDNAEIVRAIISMGHALRHRVVAEGVETVQQLAALRRFGCDEIQGYLYSPPVTGDELLTLLANADSLMP